MSRKFVVLIALAVLVVAAVLFLSLKPAHTLSDSEKSQETTIRNVTKETVYYSVEYVGRDGKVEERVLKVGDIDRFPGEYDIDVTFIKDGELERYNLDAGQPYSFRYDENDSLELYQGSHGREDAEDLAPFVPTPMVVVDKMLELAGIDSNSVIYDLGCGDGRIVIEAAKRFGARGVGIDLDPVRIEECHENAKNEGVEDLVEFRLDDVMKVDFSEATVVTLYLLPESNEVLRPFLEKYLRAGVPVVSHNYNIPGWNDKEITVESLVDGEGVEHDVYLYRR